jgi:hypothetical protein
LILVLSVLVTKASAERILAGNGPGESVVTYAEYDSDHERWEVGEPGEATEEPQIVYGADAGPWVKVLDIPGEIASGTSIRLLESIDIGSGSVPWTDWHEEIVTEGWTWMGDPHIEMFGGGIAHGFSSGIVDGNMVDFSFFESMIPGTHLEVGSKYLVYDQLDQGLPPHTGPIVIHQYPTVPEPGTLALACIGAAGFTVCIRRRRRIARITRCRCGSGRQ